jgi:hypothetical protein
MPSPQVGTLASAPWPAGATAPDPALVAELGHPLVLHLVADPPPADDNARAQLAQYAASLAAQVQPRYLFLAPGPTSATAPSYAAALQAVRAAVDPRVAVGPLLVDRTVAPTVEPFAVAASSAPVAGVPTVVEGATNVRDLGCSPGVAAIVPAGPVAASTVAAVEHGSVVCPGLAAVVTPAVGFPDALSPPASAQVTLTCDRDCLYLATLERADGTPVVARRGAARAGTPRVIGLPRTTLRRGTYRLEVRVVAQVNPGAVARQLSPPLAVG